MTLSGVICPVIFSIHYTNLGSISGRYFIQRWFAVVVKRHWHCLFWYWHPTLFRFWVNLEHMGRGCVQRRLKWFPMYNRTFNFANKKEDFIRWQNLVKIYGILTLQAPTPQSGQTHSNNSSAVGNKLFECVDHFVGLALKGLKKLFLGHILLRDYQKLKSPKIGLAVSFSIFNCSFSPDFKNRFGQGNFTDLFIFNDLNFPFTSKQPLRRHCYILQLNTDKPLTKIIEAKDVKKIPRSSFIRPEIM